MALRFLLIPSETSKMNRTATRLVAPKISRSFNRQYSGHEGTPEELAKIAMKWRTYSMYALPIGGALAFYALWGDEHKHQDRIFSYMHIRSKPFPWGDGDHGMVEQIAGKPEIHPKKH
ncbi:cytochrome c oxidase subunit 6A1, mitochondrial [Planoprotostelium fungivorum]|uniref:Cytochrome c oxidase subunit 6A1, mitochondrial n=1 Tax=Planoprotostelium fungivorum TaxID=1890364 RepID=A0A2P6NR69_9EUKA|nr:cytochrome c oxidase subunit 6A1, mitochondrial [Planoprotostelium fungivorum]